MPVLKQICLIAVAIVLQTNYMYSTSKNSIWSVNYFPLNRNGMPYGSTVWCKSGEKIDLISYMFFNKLTKEEFSAIEELELYQKCSMQERCADLRFPLRSYTQTNHTYYAVIRFRCIDPKNMMRLCDNSSRNFNDTLHLIYNESAAISTAICECWIDGKVSVILNDVRLSDKQRNACSSAGLRINSKSFQSTENITTFGSVFQRKILSNSQVVFMLLTQHSTSSPTMVWLTFEPKDTSVVTCSRTRSWSTTSKLTSTNVYLSSIATDYVSVYDNFTVNFTTQKSILSVEETNSKGNYDRSNTISRTAVIIIFVCSTCVLCAIFIGVGICCKRRKRMKSLRNTKCERQITSTYNAQAINPASEKEISPLHHTNVEHKYHRPGACDCNTQAANASTTMPAVSKAVNEKTELTDDGRYYDVSVNIESANETEQQAYAETQYRNHCAFGYDTQLQKNHPNESDTLQDENNYYNVGVKLSSTHAVYEKIQPELKCNDEEYSQLDQRRL